VRARATTLVAVGVISAMTALATATLLVAPRDPPPVRSIDVDSTPQGDRAGPPPRDREASRDRGRRKERRRRPTLRRAPPTTNEFAPAPARQPPPAAVPAPPQPTGTFVPADDEEDDTGDAGDDGDDGDDGGDDGGDDD
jgi:hypothetical protein